MKRGGGIDDGWVEATASEAQVRREREKARELRQSQWWRNQIAKGVCHYCGRTFKPSELTMDHVIPVARGGRSERGNVVPCCKECNNDKRCLTPAERILESLDIPPADDDGYETT